MQLRFLTLNVQGFRNPVKQQEVLALATSVNCDLLLLQETNFRSHKDVAQFEARHSIKGFFSFGFRRSEGVGVIVFRQSLLRDCSAVFDNDGRVVCVDLFFRGSKFRLINVYGPARRGAAHFFFKNLDTFMLNAAPFFLAGDFNCVLDAQRDADNSGTSRPASWHARELRRLVCQYDLVDIWEIAHPNTFTYTWRRGATCSRLDRGYVPRGFIDDITDCRVLDLPPSPVYISDHRAFLFAITFRRQQACNYTWRLDISLLREPSVTNSVSKVITDSLPAGLDLIHNWDRLKQRWRDAFIAGGKQRRAVLSKELADIRENIQIVQRGGAATLLMQDYLESLRARYRQALKLSSRTALVLLNRNSPVHDSEVLRYMRSREFDSHHRLRIECVQRDDGTLSSNEADIAGKFREYFRGLFTSDDQFDDSAIDDMLSGFPLVPLELREDLCRPVTATELYDTVQHMKSGSAPGPDGLPVEFYRHFWSILCGPLTRIVNTFLDSGRVPSSFKHGRVILLPKGNNDDRSDPKSWRPITLLNVDGKILTSLLSRRLKETLPYAVSPYQTCSVPGRSIFASLVLTRDLIAYLNSRQLPGVVLSLDQAKAFDRVEHEYLFRVLSFFGFPQKFVDCLRALYADLTSELLINGKITQSFPVTRGVRQGCPLSPMLFVLSVDPLLRKLQATRSIRGFPVPSGEAVVVSAYADDIVLFVRDTSSLLDALKVFSLYARASGAQLNRCKSRALTLGNLPPEVPQDFSVVNKVEILGVGFDRVGIAASNWTAITKRLEQQLEFAGRFQLSYQDRTFLIKSILCSKLWYLARVALPPPRVVFKISSLIFRFFWHSGKPLISRDLLRLPRAAGGWSLPCVQTYCQLFALRNVMAILDNTSLPTRRLVLYWLSTSRRVLVPRNLGNLSPTAESPPPYYKQIVKIYNTFQTEVPNLSPFSTPVSRLCEALFLARVSSSPTTTGTPSNELLKTARLFPEAQDVYWKLSWHVLPTKDRLSRWGLAPNSYCPNCGLRETNEHVFYECAVAKTLWRLASRMFHFSYRRERPVKGKFFQLIVVLTGYTLWHMRCQAVAQGRRVRAIYPMLSRIYRCLTLILNHQLLLLGEEDFLRQWSSPIISVYKGHVVLCTTYPA